MKIYYTFIGAYSFSKKSCRLINLKGRYLLLIIVCLFTKLSGTAQTNNYFGVSGILTGDVWSTNPGGPYNSALVTTGGSILNFTNIGSATGGSIPATTDINFGAAIVWTAGGTIGAAGIDLRINVSDGIEQDFGTMQNFSSSATAAISKEGTGSLAMPGGTFKGGFTLNTGTIIVLGVNGMGNGTLNLNGGIVASNANRNLSGRYSGINIGGDVQFGDITGLANASANLSFDNNISLGASIRTLKLGNTGITFFGGVISGTGGINFTNNIDGSGIFDIANTGNTFSGPVNINGPQTRFAADGSFGNAANTIIINGGQLLANATFSIVHGIQLGMAAGTGITVAALNTLTIDGVITNNTDAGGFTKYGAGTLVLNNANAYTGDTYIDGTGGTLQLNRLGGNTIPASNNMAVNGGVLRISTDQTLNNLSLLNGNLEVDNGITLTINGTLDYFQPANITLKGTAKIIYGASATLKYSGTIAKDAAAEEWPDVSGPVNVDIDNPAGITLPSIMGSRSITGSLALTSGTFTIGGNVLLNLDGATLNSTGGFIAGNTAIGSTSDLKVSDITGGKVSLPTNGNIGLRNITIDGTRTLALNGTDNLNLSGTLSIAAGATFDNGGESQVLTSGTPVINIAGRFITRDEQGFYGARAAIPGIIPTLIAGCTIEYGLATGSPQSVTSTAAMGQSYYNITFSGSGTKTPGNNIDVNTNGTVSITGAAVIVDAGSNNIGRAISNTTGLNMDGGRLVIGTTGTQPNMDGPYTLTGGVLQFTGAGNQTIRSKNYQNIEVTGAGVGNSSGNILLNDQGSFIVKNGGAFTINDNTIKGPAGVQTVIVETGALFKTGNNQGFHGFAATFTDNSSLHQDIENVVLQTGSTVEYIKTGISPDQSVTNTISYQNLVISGTGIKTAPTGTLIIKGDLSKTGTSTFVHNNGNILFNSAASIQNFINSGSTGFNFYDLGDNNTYSTGLHIVNKVGIVNSLSLFDNSKLSLEEEDLTLVSTATTTARIAIIPATASIDYSGSGRFIVERYFPAKRAWRLVTSPVSGTGSIYNSWQNGGGYDPGRGVLITGPNPLPVNGLDPSPLNNSSLKAGAMFTPVLDTKASNLSGSAGSADNAGYFLFVRGDRDPANINLPNTNSTTISSKGKLQTGSQTFVASSSINGFSLIGNPYASPVDFSTITRLNVENRFITWDPGINRVGGYIVADDADNDGVYTYSVIGPGAQDTMIQSGQAFFIQTSTDGPASITFSENNKATKNNLAIFRPVPPAPAHQSFRINLYITDAGNTAVLIDGTIAEFYERANAGVDVQDALKFTNINESVSLRRGSGSLAIERRPLITANDTLFLQLARTAQHSYRFEFVPANLEPLLLAFLEDSYTGTKTPVNITAGSVHDFTINGNAASGSPGRFMITFKPGDSTSLPVIFDFINARQQGSDIALEWTVGEETGTRSYVVEKSVDGLNFGIVNTTAAKGFSLNGGSYCWVDKDVVSINNYYRIRSIGRSGKIQYTQIIKVKMAGQRPGIRIYPNPITQGIINMRFGEAEAGRYKIRLLNRAGQTLLTRIINHAAGTLTETIVPAYKPVAGFYEVEITTPGKEPGRFKVIIE